MGLSVGFGSQDFGFRIDLQPLFYMCVSSSSLGSAWFGLVGLRLRGYPLRRDEGREGGRERERERERETSQNSHLSMACIRLQVWKTTMAAETPSSMLLAGPSVRKGVMHRTTSSVGRVGRDIEIALRPSGSVFLFLTNPKNRGPPRRVCGLNLFAALGPGMPPCRREQFASIYCCSSTIVERNHAPSFVAAEGEFR
jgi:hypothetical protein